MEQNRTVDTILEKLKEMVSTRQPIAPAVWLEAAASLNALLSDETELLHKMQQEVAQKKLEFLKESKSVAEVKLKIEAEDIFKFMLDQKSKIDLVIEQIRISKLQARMAQDEWRAN